MQENKTEEVKTEEVKTEKKAALRRVYNASFITYFGMLIAVALLRVFIYAGGLNGMSEDGINNVFTFISQILLLGAPPLLVLGLACGKGRKTAEYLQIKKPKPYIFFAFAIGVAGFFGGYFVAVIWNVVLSGLGYNAGGSAFSIDTAGKFLLSVLFTAIMPAVCEELTHRGMLLRAQESTGASHGRLVITGGLFFGLFHMFIGQTFYTMALGCAMVFVTLKSRSIIPAVIMHFTNNFLSIYLEYAYLANLPGKGFFTVLTNAEANPVSVLLLLFFCAVCVPLTILLLYAFLRMARRAGDAPPAKKRAAIPYGYGYGYGFYGTPNPYAGGYGARQGQAGIDLSRIDPFAEAEKAALPPDTSRTDTSRIDSSGTDSSRIDTSRPFNPYQNRLPTPDWSRTDPFGNPYAQAPPPAQFYDPFAQDVPNAPPPGNWQPIDNPNAPRPAEKEEESFRPAVRDNIFRYASLLLAAGITLLSFIIGL